MAVPEYEIRSRQTQSIYADGNAEAAARTARELSISYVYIGPDEERTHPRETLAKFDKRTDLFTRVFSNSRTRVYEVLAASP